MPRASQSAADRAELARQRCQRIEDIETIEDAWDFVRRREEIPQEVKQKVGTVRQSLSRKDLRPLLGAYGIRQSYKQGKKVVHERLEWQRYEVQRHVVAELESLPQTHTSQEAVGNSISRNARLAARGPSGG